MEIVWCSEQDSSGNVLNACRLFKNIDNAIDVINIEMENLGYENVRLEGNVEDKKMATYLSKGSEDILHWFFLPIEVEDYIEEN